MQSSPTTYLFWRSTKCWAGLSIVRMVNASARLSDSIIPVISVHDVKRRKVRGPWHYPRCTWLHFHLRNTNGTFPLQRNKKKGRHSGAQRGEYEVPTQEMAFNSRLGCQQYMSNLPHNASPNFSLHSVPFLWKKYWHVRQITLILYVWTFAISLVAQNIFSLCSLYSRCSIIPLFMWAAREQKAEPC